MCYLNGSEEEYFQLIRLPTLNKDVHEFVHSFVQVTLNMMFLQLTILFVCDVLIAVAIDCTQDNPVFDTDLDTQWNTYKTNYNKIYGNQTVEDYRYV